VTKGAAATGAGIAVGTAIGYNIANVGPAAEAVSKAYHIGLGAVGVLTTALFVTHLTMQIPGGKLVDRYGARTLMSIGLAVICAGNLVALVSPSFPLGIAGRLIVGLGTGVGFVAGSDYVRALLGSATTQGLYGAAAVGGGGLAIAIVPQTTSMLDWRAPYATALAAAAVVLLGLQVAPRDRASGEGARASSAPIREIVRDHRLYPLALAHTASFGLSVIIGNWAVTLLRDDGYGRRQAGLVAALTLLGGFVTRPLAGRAFHRSPRRAAPLLAVSMVAGSAGTVLLLLPLPIAVRTAGAAVLGLAAGIPFAAAFSGAQAIRPDEPGAAVGFINSCATLVIAVGAPLVGVSFSLAGDGRSGFAVIAALWAMSTVAVLPSRLP